MKYITKWGAVAALAILSACSTKYRVWQGKAPEQKIFNLKYGPHDRNILDIYIPQQYTENTPICIIVHGGAWKFGRKEHLQHLQRFLHKENIITASMNYRLVSKKNGNLYTDQLEDLDAAIKKILSTLQPLHPEKRNIILLGESAGGHLALLYAYQHPQLINRVISMSGPADFSSEVYRTSTYYKRSHGTFEDIVGKKYSDADSRKYFEAASPIYQKTFVPTLIFQGNKDRLVDKSQGLALDSVLTQKGIPHELIYMKNTGHVARFNIQKRDTLVYPAILRYIKKEL